MLSALLVGVNVQGDQEGVQEEMLIGLYGM
jgi:hypothetical protein